ncbi:MAG: tRNA pseudouridine(55) synthase TruB [Bacteroidaceae bacterium]|nr:tRNA pseudouridine(55) synthase TruB [Bacteroidaceae bacterium]MBR3595220.1 tRNA pseudouridine(55) synthase TruB [Candidatus Saccharibacteria bacterium]MBR6122729.1 tRNA pseudouridine(55) synthase TruB [Candidatus Saccharibacteria bacterium]
MENEIILIDKPEGITSFGVVARVRRVLSEKAGKKVKVGHTGTLDPFATGLLILLAGKATKRSNEFLKLDKEYVAEIRLGETSTTGDPEGEIQKSCSGEAPDFEEVKKVVQSFVGEIWQKVPAFSAVKVEGRRAYEMARKGLPVETPTRKVNIYNIEILEYRWPVLKIRTEVSSGTYIRTLGEDIGKKLGTGAYLTALRRTRIDKYTVDEGISLEEFMKN